MSVITSWVVNTGQRICNRLCPALAANRALVWLVGVMCWALVIGVTWFGLQYAATFLAVDECLDAGGRFDYQMQQCDF
ncbi:hypothetical protein [Shewanella sp. YIC-542]|uniref:hypothetical protein n=1 Tax=Shewanella mytili TaxID=3377111 RepID=UPI00398F7C53